MGALHILLIIVIVLVVLLFLVSVGLCTYAVFPKRFGLEETRKIELGKPYLNRSGRFCRGFSRMSWLCSFLICGPLEKKKKTFIPQGPIPMVPLGQKSATSAVPPNLAIAHPLGDVPTHVFPW